jgi:hypothetical protein
VLMTMRVARPLVLIQSVIYTLLPTMTDGRVTIAPPLDVFEDGCDLWKSTQVGHFVGHKLPYPVVNSIAKRIWGSSSLLIMSIMPPICWKEPHGT